MKSLHWKSNAASSSIVIPDLFKVLWIIAVDSTFEKFQNMISGFSFGWHLSLALGLVPKDRKVQGGDCYIVMLVKSVREE